VVSGYGSRHLRLPVGRGHASVRIPENAVLTSWLYVMFMSLSIIQPSMISPGVLSAASSLLLPMLIDQVCADTADECMVD
jgi:hypothetical protein